MNKCISYCVSVKYNFIELTKFLENNYKLTKYKNFCIINFEKGISFIFDYGCLVNWNLSYDENKNVLEQLKKFEIDSIGENIFEEYSYDENTSGDNKILNDKIYLSTNTIEEKIGISHSIAQSIKLNYFENLTIKTIEETKNIPINLAQTGKILLSSNDISRKRGDLFLAKSSINLHSELLESPEFFWEYPALLKFYETTSNYLEIKTRIDVLNKKLEVIHEIFEMLADEQKHKHSSFLEWIIIWLIAVEIFFTIFHDILKWF